jgi:uncharacterized phage-associated protein
MLIRHEREKLIQTMVYFAQNTQFCGKIKLFKLLYFLDFEHYKITGRSVTGLTYSAWKMGPVPTELFDELESPDPDMAEAIAISEIPTRFGKPMLSLRPAKEFSGDLFTKRELRLLESLAKEYRDTKADDMIEATHLENMPWDKVFNKEQKRQAKIPYEYALREDEKVEMLNLIQERDSLIQALA